MKLVQDLWAHLKEWSDWSMKDWIKAAIVAIIVIIIIGAIQNFMWQLLAKPLLGVVADGVKGFVETKKAKQELKLTTIKQLKNLKKTRSLVKLHVSKVPWIK